MSDAYFIDSIKRRNIVTEFSVSQFNLTNDYNSIKTIDKCTITLEKAEAQNLMQLRLMDVRDSTQMFLCTIDNFLYEQIKTEQSLHVSFQDFIVHLTKILESCQKNELLISLLHEDQKWVLQFYEKRSFRNLIHLFLPMKEASMSTIIFHINLSYNSIQDQLKQLTVHNQRLHTELRSRDDHINHIKTEMQRLNDVITEKDKMVFNRNCEEINKLQQTIKHLQDIKEGDEKKYKTVISQIQDEMENCKKENYKLNDKIAQDTLKTATLREELNAFKMNNTNIRDRNERLQTELIAYQTRDKKHDMALSENRRLIQDLNDKLKQYDKYISDVKAELEAEKNICNTKRNSLQIATEEIAKANGIILKQAKELNGLRKEIDNRTEVALKQELYVKEKETQNNLLTKQMKMIEEEFRKNSQTHKDFSILLKNLKDNTNRMEEKYKQKIEELQNRIISEGRYPLNSTSNRGLRINNGIL